MIEKKALELNVKFGVELISLTSWNGILPRVVYKIHPAAVPTKYGRIRVNGDV